MKSYDKTLTRLILILTKLSNNEKPNIKELAEEFGVGVRTIQRDVYQRLMYFPIEKDTLGQLNFIDGFSLDRSTLENDEMLLVYLAMSQVKTLSPTFESKINNVFAKLLNPNFSSPYFIKGKTYESIDMDSKKLNHIEQAIKTCNILEITKNKISKSVNPYKIVNFDGLWYLFARDLDDDKIKTFLIASIENYTVTKKTFSLNTDVDEILTNVYSEWFEDGNKFDVLINVKPNIAHYFKLRKIIPSQEILSEESCGSLKVRFEVSNDEDIDNIVKGWLPDIEVIEPVRYKEKLMQELRDYIN